MQLPQSYLHSEALAIWQNPVETTERDRQKNWVSEITGIRTDSGYQPNEIPQNKRATTSANSNNNQRAGEDA